MSLENSGVKPFVLWMLNNSERSQEIWHRLAARGTWVEDDPASDPEEHSILSSLQAFAEEGERFCQLDGPLYLPSRKQLENILSVEMEVSETVP